MRFLHYKYKYVQLAYVLFLYLLLLPVSIFLLAIEWVCRKLGINLKRKIVS